MNPPEASPLLPPVGMRIRCHDPYNGVAREGVVELDQHGRRFVVHEGGYQVRWGLGWGWAPAPLDAVPGGVQVYPKVPLSAPCTAHGYRGAGAHTWAVADESHSRRKLACACGAELTVPLVKPPRASRLARLWANVDNPAHLVHWAILLAVLLASVLLAG